MAYFSHQKAKLKFSLQRPSEMKAVGRIYRTFLGHSGVISQVGSPAARARSPWMTIVTPSLLVFPLADNESVAENSNCRGSNYIESELVDYLNDADQGQDRRI